MPLPPRPAALFALGGLFLLVLLAYLPGLPAPFYLDDERNIPGNPRLRISNPWDFSTLSRPCPYVDKSRPVTYYTFALNGLATGLTPAGIRAGNILLHLVNILLAFLLFRALLEGMGTGSGRAGGAALLAAALWGAHPLNSQAVLYAVQRMTLLAGTFTLAGLLLYLAGRRRRGRARFVLWTLILPCLVLGFFSKPTGALLPLGILLLEAVLHRSPAPPPPGVLRNRIWLFFVLLLAAFLLFWSFHAQFLPGPSGWQRPFTPGERVLTEGRVLALYASLLLFPSPGRFHLFHELAPSTGLFAPAATALSWAALLLVLLLAFLLRRRAPLFFPAVLWFLAFHAPEAGPLPLELAFEHRNYLPSLFPCLAAAALFLPPPARPLPRRLLQAGAVLLAVLFLAATALRASLWTRKEDFFRHDLDRYPASARLALLRAKVMKDGGQLAASRAFLLDFLARYPRPLEYAEGRGWADIQILLGNMEWTLGDPVSAEGRYTSVLARLPGHQLALANAASLLLEMGEPGKALGFLTTLERSDPLWPRLHAQKARAYLALGDGEAAARERAMDTASPQGAVP